MLKKTELSIISNGKFALQKDRFATFEVKFRENVKIINFSNGFGTIVGKQSQ